MAIREDQRRLVVIASDLNSSAGHVMIAAESVRRGLREFGAVTTGVYDGKSSELRLRMNNMQEILAQHARNLQILKTEMETYAHNLGR